MMNKGIKWLVSVSVTVAQPALTISTYTTMKLREVTSKSPVIFNKVVNIKKMVPKWLKRRRKTSGLS